jgi:polar amino acid transport system substrate-binding protein
MSRRLVSFLAVLALGVAACGGGSSTTTEGTSPTTSGTSATTAVTVAPQTTTTAATPTTAAANCPTVKEGVLTIGTDSPAFPPWFVDDDPSNGQGFESAVAYAVADQLGYDKDHVDWTVVPFNNSYAPGAKNFDFDINQISITPEREQAVDFSDGYYTVNQAIIGFSDNPIAQATTTSELAQYRLGAQIGTTSLDFIDQVIKPDTEPLVYDTNADAKAAFDAGQLDGLVLDLPTAFYVTAVEIEGSVVIGQFPAVGDNPEQFGMLFEKGNPLVACVNQALATLKENGSLDQIQQKWLSDVVDAPVITIDN